MNRSERRRAEKLGLNKKQIIDKTLLDTYERGVKFGMNQVVEIVFYMTAYTINYKLGLGKKRLPQIMHDIFNNIDAYRIGHLTPTDFDTIKKQMQDLNINLNARK